MNLSENIKELFNKLDSSDKEWKKLTDYFGGEEVAGREMKALTKWDSSNKGGTNNSEFTAFPGGSRGTGGYFNGITKSACFWSSSENYSYSAWQRNLYYTYAGVRRTGTSDKVDGLSCRCVKDDD